MSTKKYIAYGNLPFMIGGTSYYYSASYLLMHFSNNPCSRDFINKILPVNDFSKTQDQIDHFLSISLYFGIFLFFLTSTIMLLRVALNKSPAVGFDSGIIGALNRIIQNSLEQFFIWVTLYFYILRNDGCNFCFIFSVGFTNVELKQLAFWFIMGRAFYGVGYLIGHLTGIGTFRSCGFMINLTTNITMLCQIFGVVSILPYINW